VTGSDMVFGRWLVFLSLSSVVVVAQAQIEIAVVGGLSGPAAQIGSWLRDGVRDTVDAINKSGGLRGQKVSLQVFDDECNPARSREIAQRLIADGRVVAVIGHCPSAGAAVQELYEQARRPLVVPFATPRALG